MARIRDLLIVVNCCMTLWTAGVSSSKHLSLPFRLKPKYAIIKQRRLQPKADLCCESEAQIGTLICAATVSQSVQRILLKENQKSVRRKEWLYRFKNYFLKSGKFVEFVVLAISKSEFEVNIDECYDQLLRKNDVGEDEVVGMNE
uniref:Uncharacterized protein n=1 Tax=Medicago truncatula TaxID=3880 RepID=Q2HV24_MEDTR|nr:hypothetical protein MtrDRAFT_AC149032g25v2 [Medicago truncatula]